MTRRDTIDFVKGLDLGNARERRTDCPACGGHNTFSASYDNGDLVWNCFKADCTAKGRISPELSAEQIRNRLLNTTHGHAEHTFSAPDYWTGWASNNRVKKYLKANNCWEAVEAGLVDIRYDPKEDRCVFLIRHEGQIVDAVGRALSGDKVAKWRRYGASEVPFICGNSRDAIVVEDCPSACSAARVATGVALMGTSIKDSFIAYLKSFDRVFFALDPDASIKALDLAREMSYLLPASVALLRDDLKYLSSEETRRWAATYLQ